MRKHEARHSESRACHSERSEESAVSTADKNKDGTVITPRTHFAMSATARGLLMPSLLTLALAACTVGLVANHDLRIALTRYDRANALLRGARLDRFPTITASATASDARASADQLPGVVRDARDGKSDIGRVRARIAATDADARSPFGSRFRHDLRASRLSCVRSHAADTYAEVTG